MEDNLEFFKVLLDGFEEKLMIPRAFNKHINKQMVSGRRFRRKVTLCSPLCNSWPVKLHEDGGNFYLSKGWPEFVRAHNLLLGYFLVFRSHGDLRFTVKVFDRSTCVKHYGPVVPIARDEHPIVNLEEDDAEPDATRMSQAIVATQSPLSLTQQRRRRKTCCFQPDTPHCFVKTIRPFHLYRPFINVPGQFCESNGFVGKTEVILNDPKGRAWHINFSAGKRCFYFVKGWRDFRVANSLKEGDKCTFNLKSKGNEAVFQVQIQRN